MKGTSKPRLPHLRPTHPHLRVRGWFLLENAAMPPGQQVKVHKSASFVDILEVCKFTTFCDRKGYRIMCVPHYKTSFDNDLHEDDLQL